MAIVDSFFYLCVYLTRTTQINTAYHIHLISSAIDLSNLASSLKTRSIAYFRLMCCHGRIWRPVETGFHSSWDRLGQSQQCICSKMGWVQWSNDWEKIIMKGFCEQPRWLPLPSQHFYFLEVFYLLHWTVEKNWSEMYCCKGPQAGFKLIPTTNPETKWTLYFI